MSVERSTIPPIDKIHPKVEHRDLPAVSSVTTAKGSVYRYLPDGRTQRFKKAEGKEYPPQNVLVFVPNFDWVKARAPKEVLDLLGENEAQYQETLLRYVQGKGKKAYIVDKEGNKLETNQEIADMGGQALLTFGDREKVDIILPVTIEPRAGFYTYDTRKYQDGDVYKRESHLGNQVIQIEVRR